MVTMDQLARYLRIDADQIGDAEKAELEMYLGQASAAAETFCCRDFSKEMPREAELAVLMFAGHHYTYREVPDRAAYQAMEGAFHALLWPHRDPAKII